MYDVLLAELKVYKLIYWFVRPHHALQEKIKFFVHRFGQQLLDAFREIRPVYLVAKVIGFLSDPRLHVLKHCIWLQLEKQRVIFHELEVELSFTRLLFQHVETHKFHVDFNQFSSRHICFAFDSLLVLIAKTDELPVNRPSKLLSFCQLLTLICIHIILALSELVIGQFG